MYFIEVMYFLPLIFAPGLYKYFEYAFLALAVLLAHRIKEYLQVNNINITFWVRFAFILYLPL